MTFHNVLSVSIRVPSVADVFAFPRPKHAPGRMLDLLVNCQLWRRTPAAWLGLVLLLAAGCDGAAPYRAAFQEQTKALEELDAILAKVTDKDSMQAARSEVAARFNHFDAISRRNKELDNPTPDVRRQLGAEGEKLHQAIVKVHEQVRRIQAMPDGPQFLESFEHTKGLVKSKAP